MSATAVQTRRLTLEEGLPANGNGNAGMIEVAISRAAQEVQAAMVVAKKFPRDEQAAYGRIMQACKRKTLAEQAVYAYPRGNQTVEGPSIRLAEAMAKAWGNVDFGTVELEQRNGESSVMSYAWDLETNTRSTKIFTIKHKRHTRSGSYDLEDPRDIYELTANQGARRLRACILAIIPGDVVEAAVIECNKTMEGANREPLVDRIRAMLSAFAEIGVTQDMVEKRLGHKSDVTSETELVQLRKIFQSIRDNMANRDDFFPVSTKPTKESSLADRLDEKQTFDPSTSNDTEQHDAPDAAPAAEDTDSANQQPAAGGGVKLPNPCPESWIVDYAASKTGHQVLDVKKAFRVKLSKPWQKLSRAEQEEVFAKVEAGTFIEPLAKEQPEG